MPAPFVRQRLVLALDPTPPRLLQVLGRTGSPPTGPSVPSPNREGFTGPPPSTASPPFRPSKFRNTSVTTPPTLSDSQAQGSPCLDSRLGEYIKRDTKLFDSLGWEAMVTQRRGQGDLTNMHQVRHPAKRLLQHLASKGAPAVMQTPNWTPARLAQAVRRGPHKSCRDQEPFLSSEFSDFVEKSQWIVLPLSVAKTLPGLRLSPPGVVPQRGRRARLISDLTFYSVNDDTLQLAPPESMQFGRALDRVIHSLVFANPAYGPVYLLKVDLSDGFYRVWLNLRDIPKLALVLPPLTGSNEPLVALPLALPMGWVESPPWFSVVTETGADLANARLLRPINNVPAHRLEPDCDSLPPVELHQPLPVPSLPPVPVPSDPDPELVHLRRAARILGRFDIYVDDYLGVVQGDAARRSAVRRVLLHSIDRLFRPLSPDDHPSRKEPISVKKLQQGDAYWSTRKIMLGWILDSVAMTLELPVHRRERLQTILDSIPRSQKRTTAKKWHKVLGELRSMSVALPGSRGLFSQLQLALKDKSRVRLDRGVHDALADFQWLKDNLASRPTRLLELVELPPSVSGSDDACKQGMGGVIFQLHNDAPPFLWRAPFPEQLGARLASQANPSGDVCMADFELAATVMQQEAYVQLADVRERTTHTCSDNTPAIAWQQHGSVSTNSAPAYLLRIQALHQRHYRYHPAWSHIPGLSNVMSDDCSRLWRLTNAELLAYFNSTYPQKLPWRMWTPSPNMLSAVISALQRKRSTPESFLTVSLPKVDTGSCGPPSASNMASTLHYKQLLKVSMRSRSYKSSPIATAMAPSLPVVNPLGLAQLKMPSVLLRKRWPQWGPRTLV
jgi:hypothetical protein